MKRGVVLHGEAVSFVVSGGGVYVDQLVSAYLN